MNYKIFGCTNFNYVDVAEYWSRYMQKLDLDYTVYCTDKNSYDHLLECNIKCDYYDGFSQDNFRFTQFGLVRFNILEQLLKQHDYVIYSDLDAIWLEDPLEDIFNDSYDAHLSTVHHPQAYPALVRKKWGMTVCTGWMGFSKSCRDLILNFISNYNFYKGNDQQKFNEYLYSLNNKIYKNIKGHSFALSLKQYNIDILGLDKNIVHRGGNVHGAKVVHPLIAGNKDKHKHALNQLKKKLIN